MQRATPRQRGCPGGSSRRWTPWLGQAPSHVWKVTVQVVLFQFPVLPPPVPLNSPFASHQPAFLLRPQDKGCTCSPSPVAAAATFGHQEAALQHPPPERIGKARAEHEARGCSSGLLPGVPSGGRGGQPSPLCVPHLYRPPQAYPRTSAGFRLTSKQSPGSFSDLPLGSWLAT